MISRVKLITIIIEAANSIKKISCHSSSMKVPSSYLSTTFCFVNPSYPILSFSYSRKLGIVMMAMKDHFLDQ